MRPDVYNLRGWLGVTNSSIYVSLSFIKATHCMCCLASWRTSDTSMFLRRWSHCSASYTSGHWHWQLENGPLVHLQCTLICCWKMVNLQCTFVVGKWSICNAHLLLENKICKPEHLLLRFHVSLCCLLLKPDHCLAEIWMDLFLASLSVSVSAASGISKCHT